MCVYTYTSVGVCVRIRIPVYVMQEGHALKLSIHPPTLSPLMQEGHGPIIGATGIAVLVCAVWLEYLSTGLDAALETLGCHMHALFPQHSPLGDPHSHGVGSGTGVWGGVGRVAVSARVDASWAEEEIYINVVVLLLYALREGRATLGLVRQWLCEVKP
jgi:hypothetical protein